MSNSLLTIIRENIPEIKGPPRAVLMALADRANDSGKCWPSLATIAKDAGVCLSSVKVALRKLRASGLVTWTHTTTEAGDAGCNIYHIAVGGRAGDAPPRAGDGQRRTAPAPQVGQEMADGRAGDGHKASIEAPRETSHALDGASSTPTPNKPAMRPKKTPPEVSTEGIKFALWFKSTLPESVSLKSDWQESFAKAHDDIVRLDKRTSEKIRQVCEWARTDQFWQSQFMSPARLRKRNRDGITYFDFFIQKMKSHSQGGSTVRLKSKFAGTPQPELQMPT
jgi:hypothetical protein